MKESKIQENIIIDLASHGFLGFLIEYRGTRNCPDVMVFCLDRPGMVCFIEVKKPKTGRPSPGQIDNAALYKVWGHDVGFVDNEEQALAHCKKVFYGENKKETNNETHKRPQQMPHYDTPDIRTPRPKKSVSRIRNAVN